MERTHITSIGLGGGEVYLIRKPFEQFRDEWQRAYAKGELMDLTEVECGKHIVLNPLQIKLVQRGPAEPTK